MMLFPRENTETSDRDTQLALSRLELLRWTRGARKHLHEAVDQSIKNYRAWLRRLATSKLEDDRLDRFRKYLIETAPSPVLLVIDWFTNVKESVEWRRGYRGNLRNHVWTSGRERWHHKLATWAEDYCGDSSLADRLMRRIDED